MGAFAFGFIPAADDYYHDSGDISGFGSASTYSIDIDGLAEDAAEAKKAAIAASDKAEKALRLSMSALAMAAVILVLSALVFLTVSSRIDELKSEQQNITKAVKFLLDKQR